MSSAPYVDDGAAAVASGRRATGRYGSRGRERQRRDGRHVDEKARGVNVEMNADIRRGAADFMAMLGKVSRNFEALVDGDGGGGGGGGGEGGGGGGDRMGSARQGTVSPRYLSNKYAVVRGQVDQHI